MSTTVNDGTKSGMLRSAAALKRIAAILPLLFLATSSLVCTKDQALDPTAVESGNTVILAGVSAEPLNLTPGASAMVQALLLDGGGEPVANEVIRFSATSGKITAADTTDVRGIATAIFTAPTQVDTVIVSCRYGTDQVQSVKLTVQSAPPSQNGSVSITIEKVADTILANGFSEEPIRAMLRTATGTPLRGALVTFTASAGTITRAVYSDSLGLATAVLTSPASTSDLVASITAEAEGERAVISVVFAGIEFSVSANPLSLIADGRSKSTVRAVLKEANSNLAIVAAGVSFATDRGTIPRSSTTDASGVAKAELTSDTQTGTATVVGSYGSFFSDTVRIDLWESIPQYLTVSADPTVLVADNRSTSTITATVTDAGNNPVPDGTIVRFEITEGTGTIESQKATEQGVATSKLTSGTQPDTVLVTVSVAGLSSTVTVRYRVGSAAAIAVVADSAALPADGITSTRVRAFVMDQVGNPVADGTLVNFESSLGDINPSAQTVSGVAQAQLSSSATGLATVKAWAGIATGETTVRFLPGPPNSVLLSYDPVSIGVRDSGRNQTLTISADVRDSKGNSVADGTYVAFSLFSSPGGGEMLSTTEPVPTLNGRAQVSLNSGIRSGTVRVMARVTDPLGQPIVPEVRAISTEIIIFAGPPYIEDINDLRTSHLSVGTRPLNIFGWHVVNNTAKVVAVVGDKYNNPVPPGTAVYFTTSGGVVSTHTGFTDDQGVAEVTLHSAQPYPTITRFYESFYDPNSGHPDFGLPTNVIPGPIPDFEGSLVLNSVGTYDENDGIARILATSEGVDAQGRSARVWSVSAIVFSGRIDVFTVTTDKTELLPGETATITIRIYDVNGNPITPGSTILAQSQAGALSWGTVMTDDPGSTLYTVGLTNNLDPSDPDARETTTSVTISITSPNGNALRASPPILLRLM